MNKKQQITAIAVLALVGMAVLTLVVPNPLGSRIISEAKAKGYISYSADEALELAYTKCSNCHTEEKMLKYCSRCGPPFIVVTHFMRKYIDIAQSQGIEIEQFTDSEIVAIAQAWNALIGNWESDWPQKDIKKLLEGDQALIRLLETPIEDRPIEAELKDKAAPGAYQRFGLGKEKEPS